MYLIHHGILGMHWGIRRYQNEDGSLTDAGCKRYLKDWEKQYKSDPMAFTKKPRDVDGMNAIKRLNDDIDESLNKYKQIDSQIMNTMSDYLKNREYWSSVAGVVNSLNWTNPSMEEIARSVNWYAYDDGDQGSMNSIGIWAKETGKDKTLEKLGKEEANAYKDFEGNVKTKVNDILGKYGNKRIDGHATASNTMVNAIINSETTESLGAYYADEASRGPSSKGDKDVKTAKDIVAKLSLGKNNNRSWYLMKAVENCGLDDVNYKDMTDSDWNRLSGELTRLNSQGKYK